MKKEETFTVYLTEKELQLIEYRIKHIVDAIQYADQKKEAESILKKLKNA